MIRRALRAGLLLGSAGLPGVVWAASLLLCDQEQSSDAAQSAWRMSAPGLLRIEEVGSDAEYSENARDWLAIAAPVPRFGLVLRPVAAGRVIQLRRTAGAQGRVRLKLHCKPGLADVRLSIWLDLAQQYTRNLDRRDSESMADQRGTVLQKAAPDPWAQAAAAHLQAQRLQVAARSAEAVEAYETAHQRWMALGLSTRAGMALLGAADELGHIGRHAHALRTAQAASTLLGVDADPYFHARARERECLSLHALAQRESAITCYEQVSALHQAAAETDGAANAGYNRASLLVDLGRTAQATQVLDDLADVAPSARPITQGRLHFLAARLHRGNGQLGAALHAFGAALDAFGQSGELGARWEAATYLELADLYDSLAMFDEARRAVAAAMQRTDPAHAPARAAKAHRRIASIEDALGNIEAASLALQQAAEIETHLDLPAELALTRLMQWQLAMKSGATATLAISVADTELEALPAQHRLHRQLLEAVRLEQAGDANTALAQLMQIDSQQASWPIRQQLTLARAALLERADAIEPAQRLRRQLVDEARQLAAAAASRPLRAMLMRSVLPSKQAYLNTLVRHATGDALLEGLLWGISASWDSPSSTQLAPSALASDIDGFGSVIAMELLGISASAERIERSRLQSLAGVRTHVAATSSLFTPASIRNSLPADGILLAIIPAHPHSVALWIGPQSESVVKLRGWKELQPQLEQLHNALSRQHAGGRSIHSLIAELSAELLTGAPDPQAPGSLWVVADESIGTLPLSALVWPSTNQTLIDTTQISWITGFDAASGDPEPGFLARPLIHAIVAANTGVEADDRLAPLYAADHEPELIAAAVPGLEMHRSTGSAAHRRALIAALESANSVVHVAAHGYARPSALGYAGLWLASSEGHRQPDFLSLLDLSEHNLQARLVVLNACQLALPAGQGHGQPSLSFATTLSTAGVDEVIAAAWPVSDAATTVWVPAFYRALDTSQPGSAAAALRAAQLALRHSPHFRHHFYWASLAHFRRLPSPTSAAGTEPQADGAAQALAMGQAHLDATPKSSERIGP